MGCSDVIGMSGMSGSFDRMILFPPGKLAFCGIPKVGYSAWLQFLRFTLGAKDYQSHPHSKIDKNFFLFDRLNPKNQRNILENEKWTKAVFLRDPAERFLSAYLDKIHDNSQWDKSMNTRKNMTFAKFVDFVGKSNITCDKDKGELSQLGMTWCMDPHWRPQTWSCGLWDLLPQFDFVGNINNAKLTTRLLLEKVDMWHSYGKHYRTSKRGDIQGHVCRTLPPEQLGSKDECQGFQQTCNATTIRMSDSEGGGDARLYEHTHQKKSADKMNQYYTKELLEKVKKLYADDFMLWNALSKSKSGWSNGKKMAKFLNPSCLVD